MRKFLKALFIFVYLLLAVFIQPSNVFANENFVQYPQIQYFVPSTKTQTIALNKKEKEYYTTFDYSNKSEITKPSDKNNYFGFGSFAGTNDDYNIADSSITGNSITSLCISHNISWDLKNTIYTRAP